MIGYSLSNFGNAEVATTKTITSVSLTVISHILKFSFETFSKCKKTTN